MAGKPPTLVKTQRQPCGEFKLWAMSVPAFVAVNASRKRAIKKWGASGTETAAPLKDLLTDSAFQRTLLVQLATRWREVGVHWLPGFLSGRPAGFVAAARAPCCCGREQAVPPPVFHIPS